MNKNTLICKNQMGVFFYIKLIIYVAKLIFMYYNIIVIGLRRVYCMKMSIWMDDELSRLFENICSEFNMTQEEAINLFIHTTVNGDKIPFESERALQFTLKTRKNFNSIYYRSCIDNVLRRHPKSEYERIRSKIQDDIFDLYALHDIYVNEYFEMRLYEKDKSEWADTYVSKSNINKYLKVVNKDGVKVDDKYGWYELLKPYYKRDAAYLRKNADKYEFMFFVKNHNKVVMKPIQDDNTDNIRIFRYDAIRKHDEFVDIVLSKCERGVIVEEYVEQDEEFKSFNEKSVNTVRVSVLKKADGEYIINKLLQVGEKDKLVDDVTKGAYRCALNQTTGVIETVYDIKGNDCSVDIMTEIDLVGKKVSDLNKLDDIVKQIMVELPGYNFIEFDFTKTCDGWVLMDVNEVPDITGMQLTLGYGIKHELENIVAQEV